MTIYKNLALFYAILDAVLIAVSASFGAIYLLNSQIAVVCSMAILFGSFFGYKNRVKEKAQNYEPSEEELAFFDENFEPKNEAKNEPQNDANNATKNEAQNAKFRKMDIFGAFKPLRIFGYVLLILAFFALVRRGIFEPISFLAGLAIMPIGALLSGIFSHKTHKI